MINMNYLVSFTLIQSLGVEFYSRAAHLFTPKVCPQYHIFNPSSQPYHFTFAHFADSTNNMILNYKYLILFNRTQHQN